ncbi:MAG: DUF456 domain-containing protein [Flavobacteriaceae bacterium]|nr:DUF456 domain-containing protein [Flavobacteriaceae bacterium]
MDIFLIIIGLIFCIIGLIGSFTPIIPGPITSWIGLLIIHFSDFIPFDYKFLLITFFIASFIFIIDLILPVLGLKKMGGTKSGLIGASLGLLIGLFIGGLFGLILGSFFGAFSGEYFQKNEIKKSLKPAIGTFVGILTGTIVKLITTTAFLGIYIYLVYKNLIY